MSEELDHLVMLFQNGRLEEVVSSARELVKSHSRPDIVNNIMGAALHRQGDFPAALAVYEQAVKQNPESAEIYNNRGDVKRLLGDLQAALNDHDKAISLNPEMSEAYLNRGRVLADLGEIESAIESIKSAIHYNPLFAAAHSILCSLYARSGDIGKACNACNKAIEINPGYAEAYANLANTLHVSGELHTALDKYNLAITLNPRYWGAYNNRGNVLKDIGFLDDALDSYRKALEIKPDQMDVYSNYLLVLNYSDRYTREDYLDLACQYNDRVMAANPVQFTHYDIGSRDKLRIGIVSGDLWNHPVGIFLESFVSSVVARSIELYAYQTSTRTDGLTDRIRPYFTSWSVLYGKCDQASAELIHNDGIHILIDLSGHTAETRLPVFAWKPAPVQVSWLGYPNTTGLKTIDYRITDAVADPCDDSDEWYTEELYRLPDGFLCYQGDTSLRFNKELPAISRGFITFGSFNNLSKMTDEVLALWVKILTLVENSRLVLKTRQLSDTVVKKRIADLFEQSGISPERFELHGWASSSVEHMTLYNEVDIALDPFPYNGTTTTMDALWMGVPTITLRGSRHAGRVGASIMTHMRLQEFIADNREQYLAIAQSLSSDVGHLSAIRSDLRQRMIASVFCDNENFTTRLLSAFNDMWARYQHES